MADEWSMWALAIAAIIAWVAILQHVGRTLTASERNERSRAPSPPGRLPLLGHMHQLLLSKQPLHRWLHTLSQRHGPILHLQLGSVPTLVVSSPDAARLVLHTHDLAFASRSTRSSAARLFSYNYSGLSQTPYGPSWRKVKELCMTRLLNSERLQHFKPIRAREALGLVRSVWDDRGATSQHLCAKLQVRACDIISRMMLGKSFDELSSITLVSGRELFDTFYESLVALATPDIGDFLPLLKPLGLQQSLRRRSYAAFERLDTIFQRIIDHRRNGNGDGDIDYDDLLGTLLALHVDKAPAAAAARLPHTFTDDNIKAIFWDMFLGGTDTSTVAVEWGLAELVRHRSAMERLQEELDSVVGNSCGRVMGEEDIARLPYLQAVVKETLRLHPVVPLLIPHESNEPCEVGGFYVAEGTRLIVNVLSLSMDERYWENPSSFFPERFLDSDVDLRGHHFQFLPFGAGRRACPAVNLGLLNVYLMLGALVQCFDWTLPPGVQEIDMREAFDTTLHKIDPLVLMASPRLPTEFYLSLTNQ